MKEVRLNNGIMMPAIGFGVYQIPKSETQRAVSDALEVGYRSIDTAASYFNEEEVGLAIRSSGIKREEIFVTSKLWVQDYEYEDALRAFDRSLKLLGLDYIDLYLLHKPYGNYYAAWRALEKLYKEGLIRAIGVTSFCNERLQDLFLHNEIKPALNQLETHPFFSKRPLMNFCIKRGSCMRPGHLLRKARTISSIILFCRLLHKSTAKLLANVVLRWLNQRNVVVIPKSVRKDRMIENFSSFDFTLSEDEMQAIAKLDTGKKSDL